MSNQTILYAVLASFAAFIVWDKLTPRIKKVFSKKSASTQAMIDLTAAINELPKSLAAYGEQCNQSIAETVEACRSVSVSTIEMVTSQTLAQAQATADLIAANDKLTAALNSDESTKMLTGTLKACEAIASATVQLRDEVAAFGKLVRIDDKAYPEDQIIQPDKSKDEMVATFLDAITRGRSVQESEQQAKDDAETKSMFSAVTLDPTQES